MVAFLLLSLDHGIHYTCCYIYTLPHFLLCLIQTVKPLIQTVRCFSDGNREKNNLKVIFLLMLRMHNQLSMCFSRIMVNVLFFFNFVSCW